TRDKDRTWVLTFDPRNDVRPAVFEFAVRKGVKVLTLQKAERGLEEVFKELTRN
ncbi:MAG: gliding motility-associated ABC transporter ATP-binding subunit GldA, partial [Flavobacteriales bacterium]|nr:gliding motility-associated ABC transporter ATP-binding subunit GldA [Flavobacteriales bacterium]